MTCPPVPAITVKLPCYAGYNQIAMWPSPHLVRKDNPSEFLTLLNFRASPAMDY